MKCPADRRAVLLTIGAAAFAAAAGPGAAQISEIRGVVTFADGVVIPEGRLDIYLEGPALPDSARVPGAKARVESNGTSREIDFSLPGPADLSVSPASRIVARLERADGWLLARGSVRVNAGSPIYVTLRPVAY